MSEPVRIVIVDDHDIVRVGLNSLIGKIAEMKVVHESSNADDAIAYISNHPCDLVLLDIDMPGTNGIDALVSIKARHPRIKVLILTVYSDVAHLSTSLSAGADGYVLKQDIKISIESAIRDVCRGSIVISRNITGADSVKDLARSFDAARFTDREREIIKLIALGKTTEEVARELDISKRTVHGHKQNIYGKLGINNVAALVHYAFANKIV